MDTELGLLLGEKRILEENGGYVQTGFTRLW